MVLADVTWHDGRPVTAAPRHILKQQAERLARRGWTALAGTELEFMVFRDSYEEASARGYHGLTPASGYNVDYSILGTSSAEPLLRRIRRAMEGAGMYVEPAKGECNRGQYEIAFRYADALTTCDNHTIYKTGAAVAAMIAAGLHGIDKGLALEPPCAGNACTSGAPRVPASLRDALAAWQDSDIADQAFGSDVVRHYANYARTELAAFGAAVTDWELRRGFERL